MGFFRGLDQDTYDRQYSDSYLMKRIGSYFGAHLKAAAGITGIGLGLSVLDALVPIIIAQGIDELEQPGSGISQRLTLLLSALLVSVIIQFLINWVRRRLVTGMVARIVAQLRKDALAAAIQRDMAFYDENKSGKVLSRITSDTEEFGQVVLFISDVMSHLIQAVILLGVLLARNFRLTLIAVAFFPLMLGATILLRRWAREATRQGSRAMAAVNDNIQESVSGIGVAKNFRQEAAIYKRFTGVNEQSYAINLKRGFVLALVFPVLNALIGLATGGLVYAGAVAVVGGTISVSVWFLYIQATDRFWFPVINIASFWSQFQQAMSAIERIFALIDTENTIRQTDNLTAPPLKGQVVFDHVDFAYKPGQPVLEDFNLQIAPGESIAFVGHTGAGKSSIVKLMTRFYEFQGGTISVDGQDIRRFDLQSYRGQLGLVPQAPFLFSGTVMDNIRYARPEASDAEVEAVAGSIGRGEWLETLPEGLQSDVGERGARLSMGQRQLVSLLRILVQKPAIFILDEATASIDPFTEMQIQEALEMILSRSTSIMIAHRLSTVRSADRIIVLRQGKIIESGSHDSLMAQGGHYAELYNTYFRHQSLKYIEQAREMFTGQTAK